VLQDLVLFGSYRDPFDKIYFKAFYDICTSEGVQKVTPQIRLEQLANTLRCSLLSVNVAYVPVMS
jgi:hypothetical protein